MTAPPMPRMRDVLVAHVRAIGFMLRIPLLIAVVLAVIATIAIATQVASGDIQKNLLAEPSSLPGIIGALLPFAVWAREERFGPGFLWTLPVDRSRHALIKVIAGWLWLMAGVVLYSLCQVVIATVSGSGLLPVEMVHLLTAPVPRSQPVDPAMLRTVRWAPGLIVWFIPFAAATAMYLLASAVMLGVRHPFRWIVGAVVAVFVLPVLADAPARAMSHLIGGRYGLEALLTLRTWSLDTRSTLTTGERIEAWSALPNLADWRIAALLWTGAGLLAVWLAASRHRERRRA